MLSSASDDRSARGILCVVHPWSPLLPSPQVEDIICVPVKGTADDFVPIVMVLFAPEAELEPQVAVQSAQKALDFHDKHEGTMQLYENVSSWRRPLNPESSKGRDRRRCCSRASSSTASSACPSAAPPPPSACPRPRSSGCAAGSASAGGSTAGGRRPAASRTHRTARRRTRAGQRQARGSDSRRPRASQPRASSPPETAPPQPAFVTSPACTRPACTSRPISGAGRRRTVIPARDVARRTSRAFSRARPR